MNFNAATNSSLSQSIKMHFLSHNFRHRSSRSRIQDSSVIFPSISRLCLLLLLIAWLCKTTTSASPAATSSEPCEFYLTTNISDGTAQPDGSWHYDGLNYPPSLTGIYNYVLNATSHRTSVAPHKRGCTCYMRHCLRACCAPGEYVNFDDGLGDGQCRDGGYASAMWTVITGEKIDLVRDFHWAQMRPTCSLHFLEPKVVESDKFSLLRNGSVYMDEDEILLEMGQYCVGVDENIETKEQFPIVMKCIEPAASEARFVVLPIGMFLSVPFLLATFIVYACIPELRNVHGKSLMNYVLGLTVGYTILASVQFYGNREECRDGTEQCFSNSVCATLGYIIYLSFMVSFFWLNTMCFDIFWTFRGVRGGIGGRNNFIYYCIYAWGVPVLLTLLVVTLQYTDIVSDTYKPNIGKGTCFFSAENILVEFVYLYLILLILVCANIVFFVITAIRIQKVQQETSSAINNQGSSAKHSRHSYEKYRFWLYLRLFVVMGASWSLEVISWAIDSKSYYFYVTDLYNCIQGILIFFLVVWNEKVKKLVVKRVDKYRGIKDADIQTSIRTLNGVSSTGLYLQRSTSIPMERGQLITP